MPHRLTSIPSSALPQDELGRVLADYVALDEARVFRRLLVTRFGLLALVAVLIAIVLPALPTTAKWMPTFLFLVPPVWAWIAELRLEARLARRLDGVEGVDTREIPRTIELDDC